MERDEFAKVMQEVFDLLPKNSAVASAMLLCWWKISRPAASYSEDVFKMSLTASIPRSPITCRVLREAIMDSRKKIGTPTLSQEVSV
jgi:hypothetical protein